MSRCARSATTRQNIATYLKTGATRENNISYPNESYGYGILNIKGAFEQLR